MLACMDGLLVFSKIAHQPLPYVLPLLIYCLYVPPFYRLASFHPAASTIWLQYNLLRTSSVSRQQYRLWWRTKPEAPQYQPIPQPTHQVARVCKDITLVGCTLFTKPFVRTRVCEACFLTLCAVCLELTTYFDHLMRLAANVQIKAVVPC